LFKNNKSPKRISLFCFSHYIFRHTAVTRKIVSQDKNTVSQHGHEGGRACFAYGIISNTMIHPNVFIIQPSQLHPRCSHKWLGTIGRVYRRLMFLCCK